ncbi:SERTA domain-containing protein 1 [Xenopus laevis]|uniref:SERTA domain-containing protein n=2 Tax=Xenopus laevis TaxID=8355 RepID=A0A974C4G8_XENLA|nr:SERTA domain-containing protein 1 [Xenopus laevis]OCT66267.1 hypothetical protein XELAEV_18042525mg [Xenopus laevis]
MLAKGIKRKYSEVDGGIGSNPDPVLDGECPCSFPAIQSHCLMNISLVKLHRSLRHVEPDLRHLVLVANTLRRLQGNLQVEPCSPGMWKTSEECTRKEYVPAVGTESKKPALENAEDPLLSCMDATLYSSISTILEDLNHFEGLSSSPLPQIEDDQLSTPKSNPVSGSTEDMLKLASPSSFLSSSPYLLGDNLEDIFEDIDTSMYDSDPWASSNLLNFKTFSNVDDIEEKNGESTVLALSEWDYLMDAFGESQGLLANSAVSFRTQ